MVRKLNAYSKMLPRVPNIGRQNIQDQVMTFSVRGIWVMNCSPHPLYLLLRITLVKGNIEVVTLLYPIAAQCCDSYYCGSHSSFVRCVL